MDTVLENVNERDMHYFVRQQINGKKKLNNMEPF